MTTRSKIVGLTQHISDQSTRDDVAEETNATTDMLPDDVYSATYDDAYELQEPRRSVLGYLVPTLLLGAFVGWTAFFAQR